MSGMLEVGYGVDEFNRPKVLSKKDSICQIVMNVLLSKPGGYPSIPSIGVNIRQFIEYVSPEEVDITMLQGMIQSQLNTVLSLDIVGEVLVVQTSMDNQPMTLIVIPITVDEEDENATNMRVVAGFSINSSKELLNTIEAQIGSV